MTVVQDTSSTADPAAAGMRPSELVAALADLNRVAAAMLVAPPDDGVWPDRVRAVVQRLADVQQAAPDAVLYLLYYTAARKFDRYSSHHALVCAATARECARTLGHDDGEINSLMAAALTMNLSITALQDELVHRERALTMDQRQAIDRHPAQSAEMLARLGVHDGLWLDVVKHHHDDPAPDVPHAEVSPMLRLAHLLRRVDVFAAKMSPRKSRKGMAPTQAARDAYLGRHGAPDPIGIAMTRSTGIYPPGSLVMLANGETAIVLRRGARPSRPTVASLVGADRRPLASPLLRPADSDGSLIHAVARTDDLRAGIDHLVLLGL